MKETSGIHINFLQMTAEQFIIFLNYLIAYVTYVLLNTFFTYRNFNYPLFEFSLISPDSVTVYCAKYWFLASLRLVFRLNLKFCQRTIIRNNWKVNRRQDISLYLHSTQHTFFTSRTLHICKEGTEISKNFRCRDFDERTGPQNVI